MQNQFFLHQYWKFMHFSPYMPLARRPSKNTQQTKLFCKNLFYVVYYWYICTL